MFTSVGDVLGFCQFPLTCSLSSIAPILAVAPPPVAGAMSSLAKPSINLALTSFLNVYLIWNNGVAFGLLPFEKTLFYNHRLIHQEKN